MKRRQPLNGKTLALALALPLCMSGTGVMAQDLILEEIIVTAQKRVESVQDIPSTVNVIGGDTLKDFNILNFTDIQALTAGLNIATLTGRSGRMSLRGISHNPSSASQSTVTVYWNQAIMDSNAVYQQLFDIERMEVLRGPQGTLAGRTSPAGSINIHTSRPNLEEREGEIRATVNDKDGLNTQVAASFPLIPGKLALRVAGVYDESDLDEIKNDLTGEVTHSETSAGRISLSWLPTDSFTADLAIQYLDRENDDVVALEGTPTGSPALDPEGVLRELDSFDRRGALVGIDGVSANTEADFLNSSLVLEWDLGTHTVTSVTGYHETESTLEFDQALGNANPNNVARRIAEDDRTDWSQELRLANNSSETWEYMVGAYYENADILFTQDNYLPVGSPLAPGSGLLLFPAEVQRLGLFTHNKLYLSDRWTLQLGLRYQDHEVEADMLTVAGPNGLSLLQPGELLNQVLAEENQQTDDDSVTGQVTLQYQLQDDLMVYGHVGTGWRPGGITVTGTPLPEEVLQFDSEDSISYELGFKSVMMGGAMRLNGSLYYQDFDDYISRRDALSIRDLTGEIVTAGITTNGDAEVWGAELELTAALSEHWLLGGALSYNEGEYSDGTELPCSVFDDSGVPVIPEGQFVATCDVGGEPIGPAPDWTASLNSEYSISFEAFEGYGRVLYSYTGERYNASGLGDLDPYHVVDLFLGLRGDQWNMEVYARNLFDEEEIAAGTLVTPLVARQPTGYGRRWPVPSRSIGLSAAYHW